MICSRWRGGICTAVFLSALLAGPTFAQNTPDVIPSKLSLLEILRRPVAVDFCGEPVPLEDPEVRERFEKELLLSAGDEAQMILWLKRSTRYLPMVRKLLRENGMPADLQYVAVAESALLPHAGSRKGAMGYWQFIRETGRRYGLRIDSLVDERRNIHLATAAAVRYFRKLHDELGAWTLVVAAYNMGEAGLKEEIETQETRDFYRLYLPLETQRYLFRILAIKMILSDPMAFGLDFRESDGYLPYAFDRVTVKIESNLPLREVARAAGTDFKAIKDLNPQFRGHFLVKGEHEILVPRGAAAGFGERLAKVAGKWNAKHDKEDNKNKKEQRVYIVHKGDSLISIARKFNVTLTSLLKWNNLNPESHIHPGDRLVVSPGEGKR